jgi:hypothetical protein
MYRLGDDAHALLEARGVIPSHDWVLASRIGGNSSTPSKIIRLAHDHMASEIALDIEIGARSAGAPFSNHIEIIAAAPARTRSLPHSLRVAVPPIPGAPKWIEPDALFAIGERYYAIEADRGTESIETIIKPKIIAYREIVASCVIDEHFGIDNIRVLFVTTNETRMRNMMDAVASIATNGRSRMFGFAFRPDLANFTRAPAPTGRMFAQAWERVGYEPLQLGNE